MSLRLKVLFIAALLPIGTAYAGQESQNVSELEAQEFVMYKGWYCVSESPSNMQSSGHIGYGHGKSRAESARRAVEDCGRSGGFGCGPAECSQE